MGYPLPYRWVCPLCLMCPLLPTVHTESPNTSAPMFHAKHHHHSCTRRRARVRNARAGPDCTDLPCCLPAGATARLLTLHTATHRSHHVTRTPCMGTPCLSRG